MEENEQPRLNVPHADPGWLEIIQDRGKVFSVLVASLSLDALFLLIWLSIHVLFTFSTTLLQGWLEARLHVQASQASSFDPFKAVFFITTLLLDVSAFFIMVFFIFKDVKTFWKKISTEPAHRSKPVLDGGIQAGRQE